MKRVLCLSFPMWSIDLVRRRLSAGSAEPRSIVLTAARDAGEVVAACCEYAARAGVQPEMRLADARALLTGRYEPWIERIDETRERAALHALATWALRFSPIVVEDPCAQWGTTPGRDSLLLDAFGLARLFGSEATWLRQTAEGVAGLGIHVRAAIADTIGCAWAVAHYGTSSPTGPVVQRCIASGEERAALAPLPIESLRVDTRTVEALFEVGLERVEHLLALPRHDLARRFGDTLLLRLDQALGAAYEVVRPNRVVQPIRAEIVFHGPVKNLEAVLQIVDQLTRSLCDTLDERQVGAREVVLELARYDASPTGHVLALTRPSTNAPHLALLLRNKVERTHLGGGIELMTLTASKVSALEHHQRLVPLNATRRHGSGQGGASRVAEGGSVAGGNTEHPSRRLGALFDVLIERCGKDRVVEAESVASHVPEHAFRTRLVDTKRTPTSPTPEDTPRQRSDRPSLLYERPEPAEAIALLPDGPPSWLRWRREEVKVISALGPERIGAPWWNGRGPPSRCLAYRDYFRILDDRGRWLWVFRGTETGHWFVHGEWA